MKKLYTVLAVLCISIQLYAQDVHFSHIHASPTFLNPAMTGLFNGDLRFIANYKSQWQNVTNAYKTAAGQVDMKLLESRNNTILGGGILVAHDKAGDLDFTTNVASLNLSVIKALDRRGDNYVSFGVQNSFYSQRLSYGNIVAFDNEPTISNGVSDKIDYWDLSAGIGWFYAYNRDNLFYLGGSLFHINEPLVSFFERENISTEGTFMQRKLVLHGGADFKIGRYSYLKPTFLFMDQGPHREITLGSFWKYAKLGKSLNTRSSASIYFGAWFRWYVEKDLVGSDAVIASVRLDYQNTLITFSFDINVSTLTRVSSGSGGPELSVIKILDLNRKRRRSSKVKCPAF